MYRCIYICVIFSKWHGCWLLRICGCSTTLFFPLFSTKKRRKKERENLRLLNYTSTHIHTHICIYIYVCIYVCLYMYISQRPVCMYVHIYITVPNVLIWGTYIYRGTYIYISQRPHTYIYHSAHRALLRYIHIYISQRPTCWFGAPRPPRAPSRGCMSQCSCSPRYSAFFFCALAMCVCVCVCVVCVCMYVYNVSQCSCSSKYREFCLLNLWI